jgi:RES domain-containing protein
VAFAPAWCRLGYYADPLGFKPAELYAWNNRFDDELREFRTLYAATDRLTCVYELAQDLVPDAAAITEFQQLFPQADPPAAEIPRDWWERLVFQCAALTIDTYLIDLTDPEERHHIEVRHADVLAEHHIAHLDLGAISSSNRRFTQSLARRMYDQGASGVVFPSNVGPGSCVCLFEGRGQFDPEDEPEALHPDTAELVEAATAWGLTIER